MSTEFLTKLFNIVDKYMDEDGYVRCIANTINIYTASFVTVSILKLKNNVTICDGWYLFKKGKHLTEYKMSLHGRRIFIDGFIPVHKISF